MKIEKIFKPAMFAATMSFLLFAQNQPESPRVIAPYEKLSMSDMESFRVLQQEIVIRRVGEDLEALRAQLCSLRRSAARASLHTLQYQAAAQQNTANTPGKLTLPPELANTDPRRQTVVIIYKLSNHGQDQTVLVPLGPGQNEYSLPVGATLIGGYRVNSEEFTKEEFKDDFLKCGDPNAK